MKPWKNLDGSDFDFTTHVSMMETFFNQASRGKRYFVCRGLSNDEVPRYPLGFLQLIGGLLFVQDVYLVAGTECIDRRLRKSPAFVDVLVKHLPTRISTFHCAPKAANGLTATGVWCLQVAVAIQGVRDESPVFPDKVIEAIAQKAVAQALFEKGKKHDH